MMLVFRIGAVATSILLLITPTAVWSIEQDTLYFTGRSGGESTSILDSAVPCDVLALRTRDIS